jgi:purine-nucleoside phosphorylase
MDSHDAGSDDTDYFDKVREAADAVRAKSPGPAEIAVVLGSGLGEFANSLGEAVVLPYDALPHWPRSRVVGHEGKLVVGTVRGRRIAALSGRSHLYEGHDVRTVAFAVRALGLAGARTLILTNAAGGVNTGFSRGALMIIDDHLNLTGANPLVGPNDDRFGPRFPDMTEVYSARLRALADRAGREINLLLPHGVYAALLGPSYETPAEIRYLRTIGADAVGMSTVPEAIAARHMGLEVLGISCITNMAAGVLPERLDHAEVMETTRRIKGQFIALLEGIIGQL